MSRNTLRLLAIHHEGKGLHSITGAEEYDLDVDENEEAFDVNRVPYPVLEVKESMPPEDFEKFYVVGQTLRVRPKFPEGTQKRKEIIADGSDVALFTGLPAPARVIVTSQDPENSAIPTGRFETEIMDGDLEFIAEDADIYNVAIIAFPYYQEFVVTAVNKFEDDWEEI